MNEIAFFCIKHWTVAQQQQHHFFRWTLCALCVVRFTHENNNNQWKILLFFFLSCRHIDHTCCDMQWTWYQVKLVLCSQCLQFTLNTAHLSVSYFKCCIQFNNNIFERVHVFCFCKPSPVTITPSAALRKSQFIFRFQSSDNCVFIATQHNVGYKAVLCQKVCLLLI